MMKSDIKGTAPHLQVICISHPSVRALPAVSSSALTSSVTEAASTEERHPRAGTH